MLGNFQNDIGNVCAVKLLVENEQ